MDAFKAYLIEAEGNGVRAGFTQMGPSQTSTLDRGRSKACSESRPPTHSAGSPWPG